jgi:predicted  nucleic acid-binding Zn-ribbon protein
MTPDVPDVALTARLDRIKKLTDDLARVQHDAQAARDLVDRIRRELDAARAALEPHDTH